MLCFLFFVFCFFPAIQWSESATHIHVFLIFGFAYHLGQQRLLPNILMSMTIHIKKCVPQRTEPSHSQLKQTQETAFKGRQGVASSVNSSYNLCLLHNYNTMVLSHWKKHCVHKLIQWCAVCLRVSLLHWDVCPSDPVLLYMFSKRFTCSQTVV